MAVRCNVTASQASFSNVIGEPGHTKPQAARTTLGRKLLWFVLVFVLSTWTEGLPAPRKTGNLRFRYSQHWDRN
jgi:hypothetical protein